MKYQVLAALFAIVGSTNAHNPRHAHIAANKRQETSATPAPSSDAAATTGTPITTATATETATDVTDVAGTTTTTSPAGVATPVGPIDYGTSVPPLAELTLGMPSGLPYSATGVYAAGATPPISGAPGLPTPFVYSPADGWPEQDKVPPTDSDEVKAWLKELDGYDIPDLSLTVDGTCGSDPEAAASAESRGWWTCGGHTRDTDIVSCPDKLTWGVSFDDGPGPYTGKLLGYLDGKDLLATFFVVGSRVIERPTLLVEEYMAGHEISVHTWSHRHLTTLSNEQIVAELGWTRKAISTVLGVSPTTMRPPYGDIDDRVRAISLAMGLIPIMWTRTDDGHAFDTFDWEAAGGLVSGEVSFDQFQNILGNASTLDTGFIVLQHDLYEITVDLAMGYTLAAAETHDPAFKLEPIGQCAKIPTTDLYRETNTNTSFPFPNSSGIDADGDGQVDTPNTASEISSETAGSNVAVVNAIPLLSAFSAIALAALASVL